VPTPPRPPAPRRRPADRAPLRGGATGAFTSRRAPGSRRVPGVLRTSRRRYSVGFVLVVVPLLVITGKLWLLQGVDSGQYALAATQDRIRVQDIAPLRGSVVDRDGNPLAYTAEAFRVTADPTLVADPARTALALTTLLDVPVSELTDLLSEDGRYVVLASQVPP
jgi:cell division protein FtsI (penicillin-binding protein 3)